MRSGGPERYIAFSLPGKKLRWLSTSSVFENFTPTFRPSERPVRSSRSMNSLAWAQVVSFSKAASARAARCSPSASLQHAVEQLLAQQRGLKRPPPTGRSRASGAGHRLDLGGRAAVKG